MKQTDWKRVAADYRNLTIEQFDKKYRGWAYDADFTPQLRRQLEKDRAAEEAVAR